MLEGTIRLYKLYGDYKEATAALLRDDRVFGKLSIVEGRWRDVFVEAVTDVRVARVQKSALTEVIKRRLDFAMKLFSFFSERLWQSDEVIESLFEGECFGESNGSGTGLEMRLAHQAWRT